MIERYLSPAELRRLLSALLVVAVFLCLLALFAFLIVPGTRNANAPAAEAPVSAPQGESGWLDPTDYPAARGRIVPPIDPRTVLSPNPALMARGREVYAQTCATCHGATGQGDGPGGKGLNPPPRRFTQPGGWKNGPGIPQIYQTLEKGVPGSSMVSYNYLSRRDRMALVHVVRSLAPFNPAPGEASSLEALGRLFASSGEVIPNRIPVSRAMQRLAEEFPAQSALDLRDPRVAEAVEGPVRAALVLGKLPGWRDSEAALARGVSAGLPGNGFRPGVAAYTPSDWKLLQKALLEGWHENH